MRPIDTSENKIIASLSHLAGELEKSRTPRETLRAVRRGFTDAFGRTSSIMLSTAGLPAGEYRLLQMNLDDAPGDETDDPKSVDALAVHQGGTIANIIRNPQPQLIQDVDWSNDYLHGELAGYGSVIAVPLAGENLPMNWVLLLERSPSQFTIADLEETVLRTVLVGSLLESQTLGEKLAQANERIEIEMRQVGELQRALLPDPLPRIPGLELAASYEPSGRAGGDLYDIFPIDEPNAAAERWCIFLGDASGHGVAAAVVVAIVQAVLHAHPARVRGPADLLLHANRHLCRKNIGGFVTAFLALYEPGTGQLTYASAGHPPPLLKAAGDGIVSQLNNVASIPLGIEEAETFGEASVKFRCGDTLLLYTDGVTEARAPDNSMLELKGLERAFVEFAGSPEQIVAQLRQMVNCHQREHPQVDDQTLVAIRAV